MAMRKVFIPLLVLAYIAGTQAVTTVDPSETNTDTFTDTYPIDTATIDTFTDMYPTDGATLDTFTDTYPTDTATADTFTDTYPTDTATTDTFADTYPTDTATTDTLMTDTLMTDTATSATATMTVDITTTIATPTYCNVMLTASLTSQTFTSQNYPSNYDNDMDCYVSISTTSADLSIQLIPGGGFSMEPSDYCTVDYVAVYDGSSASAPLLGQYCGTTIPATISGSSQYMYIQLISDASFTYTGGSFDYIAIDNSYPNCKAAFKTYTATSSVQTFQTTGTTYSSNTDEYYLIDASGTGDLILNLVAMDVENAQGCIYDRIIIYNGGCTRYDTIDTHCGKYKKRWELTGSEYLVHFHSDGSVQHAGFTMEYFLGTAATGAPTTTTTTVGPPIDAEVNLVSEVLTNYSSENTPNKDLSTSIGSTVDVYFVGVNDLDEVNQKFTSTMQFVIRWKDDFLSWPVNKQSGITQLLMPQDDIWKPDFALLNGFETISQMGSSFMFVVVGSNGSCLWQPYQILESVCQVDMTDYPYDTQSCELKFSTWSSDSNDVTTTVGENGIAKHDRFVEHAEWKLISISQRNDTENGKAITVFTITIKRNHAFIIFYIAVPVIMLSFMSAFTFALPLSSGEKSGFGITVFLSFVVYLIVTFQKLPENSENISYFSIYVLTMTCVSGLSVMIITLQTRMLTLETKNKPIVSCTRVFTKKIIWLQNKLLCINSDSRVENTPPNTNKSNPKDKDDNEQDDDEDKSIAWPDFVSALDFVCFWVYLFAATCATCYFMIYLGVQ